MEQEGVVAQAGEDQLEEYKMSNNKLISIICIILLSLFSGIFLVSAGVVQTDAFYDASGNSLNNVQNVMYHCGGAYTGSGNELRCTNIGSLLHNINSGGSNSITFEYPYNPFSSGWNPDYYAKYLYRECYMPRDYVDFVWGDGAFLNYNHNFEKARSCHSPIDSFSITNTNYANEPVVVNVAVVAEADALSAFTDLNNGEVWYPPSYRDYYSAETKVTFSVMDGSGNAVHTESKRVNVYMDTTENVQFSWTPAYSGNYTAKINTEVTDCQCESNFQMSSQKIFTVLEERPRNQCYTIINDLETTPTVITEGNLVTIEYNKISNYADNSYSKTAIPTSVSYEIKKDGVVVFSQNSVIPANTNTDNYQRVELGWTPDSGGDYSIKVTGVGQSPLCFGKTNLPDTEILGIFVSSTVRYNVQFVVKDNSNNPLNQATVNFGSATGNTDSFGRVNFRVNPGSYNWQVSKTEYITQNGNLVVDRNITFTVQLSPTTPTCTEADWAFTLSPEICPSNGLQTKTWTKIGSCIGGISHPSTEIVSCIPNIPACTSFTYSDWGLCSLSGTQTRTIISSSPAGCTGGNPVTTQTCTPPKKHSSRDSDRVFETCEPLIQCSGWSECFEEIQTRTCKDLNSCEDNFANTEEQRVCGTTREVVLSLKSHVEESKWKGWFLLALPILLIIVCIGIIFAMFLARK